MKTSWKPADQYVDYIPCIPNSILCPVQAWLKYYEIAPKGPELPALWVHGGIPLCASACLGALTYALTYAYTLYSIRGTSPSMHT